MFYIKIVGFFPYYLLELPVKECCIGEMEKRELKLNFFGWNTMYIVSFLGIALFPDFEYAMQLDIWFSRLCVIRLKKLHASYPASREL